MMYEEIYLAKKVSLLDMLEGDLLYICWNYYTLPKGGVSWRVGVGVGSSTHPQHRSMVIASPIIAC